MTKFGENNLYCKAAEMYGEYLPLFVPYLRFSCLLTTMAAMKSL